MLKINILDYAVIDEGETAADGLLIRSNLAQTAEQFGYHHSWMAEHHV